MSDDANDSLRQAALDYHKFPKPGKLEIRATKPMANGRDLARAYSPGVAEACLEIKANPDTARDYTARGNLVAVVPAARVSDRTAFFYLGKQIEYDTTEKIFMNPTQAQTEAYISGRFG